MYEGKAKTSFPNHIEHENPANTTRSEINLKTAELTTYIWGRREDPTEKEKVTEPQFGGTQAPPTPAHRQEEGEPSRDGAEAQVP